MNQTILLKIALFFSCFGVLSLLFILYYYEVEPISVFDAKNSNMGTVVKITGLVNSVSKSNSSTKIVISSLDKITIVVFDDVDVDENKEVVVEGEVDWYNGKAQILANSITIK